MTKHLLTLGDAAPLVPNTPSEAVTAERIRDDDPIPLKEACKLFPLAKLTPSTLRAERKRKRLKIFRLGRRDYTTLRSMREMVRRCEEQEEDHQSSSSTLVNGPSTAEQAALMSKLRRLTSGNRDGDARKPS